MAIKNTAIGSSLGQSVPKTSLVPRLSPEQKIALATRIRLGEPWEPLPGQFTPVSDAPGIYWDHPIYDVLYVLGTPVGCIVRQYGHLAGGIVWEDGSKYVPIPRSQRTFRDEVLRHLEKD